MEQRKKTYYYDLGEETVRKAKETTPKPKLLLHTCCAICATVPLEKCAEAFDLTLYFNNSNIYPEREYDRRLNELRRYLTDHYPSVKLIVTPYQHEDYMKDLEEFKDSREGGVRCKICYTKRMKEAYDYAEKHGFDFFSTVMTISRQKNSLVLNQIGEELSESHPRTAYFYSDFKKNGGQDRSIELRNLNGLYQQTYCGCEYSVRDHTEH
ncbi:MAG: epoxyqueuosine reductase QueH [Erysipelotrichales bacterium]|nr:epoxyqueuosine reductase QueH [Erysipelotrichales bacterium]